MYVFALFSFFSCVWMLCAHVVNMEEFDVNVNTDDADDLLENSLSEFIVPPDEPPPPPPPLSTSSPHPAPAQTAESDEGTKKKKQKKDSFPWKDDLVQLVIDRWQEEPVLYNIRDKAYHDKVKRSNAFSRILESIKENNHNPVPTHEQLADKMHTG